MRLHVVSLPHSQTTRGFDTCAFTAKVRKFADMMRSLGHEVIHLISPARSEPHHPPPFLRVDGEQLRYDVGQLPLGIE